MSSPNPFSIRSERVDRAYRLSTLGELDATTVSILKDEFEAVFSDDEVEMIVVDLTELSYIDSSGLRLLVDMTDVCEHADRLRVVNVSPAVARVFEISGLRDYLPVISDGSDQLEPRSPRGGGGS